MRKYNLEAGIQLLILFSCTVLLAFLLITGLIKYFVHPRLEKYLWFSVAGLVAVACALLPMLAAPRRGFSPLPYLILLAPVVAGLAMPIAAPSASSSGLGSRLILPGSPIQSNAATAAPSAAAASSLPDQIVREIAPEEDPLKALMETADSTAAASPAETPQAGTDTPQAETAAPAAVSGEAEVISDDDYLNWYLDAFDHPEKYDGKTVKIKGTVFRMDGFEENQFVPARMSMVCCAADMAAIGFMCKSDDAKNWATNDWVWVTAKVKVEYEPIMGITMPVLYATEISPAEKPEDELVYF